ncbi:MAG: winged helix-turn-helix domain-containing protein [Euryarchaeota archaeon]|nr:winged helix-turn-helix domain-containing protein [Euryarchaeota archaeon]
MTKITLDRETFKALASDTRLNILKSLDGKKMNLNDIIQATNLNKATLHEHMTKLNEAGLVKKHEREGHKWVYYQLTWKGESLLHPENTRIVVLFTTTFIALWVGILQLIWYVKGTATNIGYKLFTVGEDVVMTNPGSTEFLNSPQLLQDGYNASSHQLYSYNGQNVSALPSDANVILNFLKGNSVSAPSGSIPLNGNLLAIQTESDAVSWATGSSLPPNSRLVVDQTSGVLNAINQDPLLLYIALACFIVFTVVLCVSLWRFSENRLQKL